MVGDDATRFCGICKKNVYNLSAMDREEAESFLERHLGSGAESTCARIFRRPDGTILTSECAMGAESRHLRRVVRILAAGVASAALAAGITDLATRPVLGPDHPDDAVVDDLIMMKRAELGLATIGEIDSSPHRYDVDKALRSDERTTGELEPEGEGPARRRYVRPEAIDAIDDGVIKGRVTLVTDTAGLTEGSPRRRRSRSL